MFEVLETLSQREDALVRAVDRRRSFVHDLQLLQVCELEARVKDVLDELHVPVVVAVFSSVIERNAPNA